MPAAGVPTTAVVVGRTRVEEPAAAAVDAEVAILAFVIAFAVATKSPEIFVT
jgi:hypothetical protein